MGATMSIAIPDYRPLKTGELVRRGDEVWTIPKYRGRHLKAYATWLPAERLVGQHYRGNGVRVRRPVVPVTGKDVFE